MSRRSFNNLWHQAKKIDPSLKYRKATKDDLIKTIMFGSGEAEIKPSAKAHKQKLDIYENADKDFHEEWGKGRKPMNIPHPFRCVLCGPPNCGKTSMIMNLLEKNRPMFEEVIVIHCDPEYTKEYDGIGAVMTNEIPEPSAWNGDKKTLVILDDLEYKNLNKEQKRNLDRLFGFVSTHKNISCCLSAQDAFNIPTGVRRCANLWVLWKIDDEDSIKVLSRKIRLSAGKITKIFNDLLLEPHDSLMVDNTAKSPYKLRKNGTMAIDGV